MPVLGLNNDIDYAGRATIANAERTESGKEFADAYQIGLKDRGFLAGIGAAVGLAGVDLADTVTSSVGLTERGEINQTALSAFGSPGLMKWQEENQGAIEFGSGIAGVLLADAVAGKILKSGGVAMRAIRSVPYARNLATLDRQYDAARRLAELTTRETARRGMMGVERFAGSNMNFPYMGANFTTSRSAATRNLLNAGIRRGLARNLMTEGVMAATLNENSMLYSDDLGHNIAWGLAGLGVGAGIDSLIGSYTLRKYANSDQIRQLNRGAYDITGLEGGRLHALERSDAILKESGYTGPVGTMMFQGGGGITDRVSNLAVQAAELEVSRGTTEAARTLFGQRVKLATPLREEAAEHMQKVTVRGFTGVRASGFSMNDTAYKNIIEESLARDPMTFWGIEEIATSAEEGIAQTVSLRRQNLESEIKKIKEIHDTGGIKTTRKNKDGTYTDEVRPLTEEESAALQARSQELIFKNSQVPQVMIEPGEWAPMSVGGLVEKYRPRKVIREGGLGVDNRGIWSIERSDEFKTRLGIDNDLKLYLPDGKSDLAQLDSHEMIHMYHVAETMVQHFKKSNQAMVVPENANWFQLDIAERLIQETKDPSLVQYPGAMTRQSASTESFAQKVEAIKSLERAAKNAKETLSPEDMFRLKITLNLPRIDSHTANLMEFSDDPVDLLLAGFKDAKTVRESDPASILAGLNGARKILGLTDETAPTLESLMGNSFRFLMGRDNNPFEPILGMRRPMAPYQWTRDEMLVRQGLKQGNLRNHLLGDTADEYSRLLAQTMTQDPSFAISRNVQELADDQHRSMVPGFRDSAPQTTRGAFMNAITSRGRRDVDNPTMLALSRQRELATRATQAHVQQVFQRVMGDSISEITSTRNAKSLMLMNQFGSFRGGWVLKEKPVQMTLPDGTTGYSFALDEKSVLNQRRFQQTYNQKLEKGQALLSPEGRTIVLDQLSMDVLTRMQGVHNETLAAKNTALRSQGLPEIQRQHWYWPPPNLKGKYVGFTFDAERNAVPGMGIVANSPEELARKSEEMMKSDQWQDGYLFRTRDDVTSYMNLWDKAQMEFLDPSVNTAVQFNKRGTGTLAGNKINSASFQEALMTMRDSMIAHGDDMVDILHDDVIKSLHARAEIAKVETAVGSRNPVRHSSIYDRALQNIRGTNALNAGDSLLGKGSAWLENTINGLLKKTANSSAPKRKMLVADAFNQWVRHAKPGESLQGKSFDELSKQLGQYMPFKSVNEMIESQTAAKVDPEVQAISAKLSWFEAGMRLRWFESMHAVVNMGGIITNTPAIIRALQPRAGESMADAAARNSSIAMPMSLSSGESIVLPNIPKLMWQGMRDTWRDTGDEVIEAAKREGFNLGFMDQEVAEFNAAWGAIESKTGWKKFFMGDPNHTGNKLGDKFIRNGGVDRALGVLSDKSEQLSRQWGMQMGYRAGRAMGIDDPHQLNMFAHELTNKMIANYDPRNRPEVFQGPFGALAGLFQSYVLNYYERMFRYLETGEAGKGLVSSLNVFKKDSHPAAVQYAMQSAMFGLASSPGWQALNWAFFDRGQGKGEDPVESIYARFGQTDGDLLMHGVISNLPKIFGAEGINLYTRGDAQVRLPGSEWKMMSTPLGDIPLPNIPAGDTLMRIARGLGAGFGALREQGSDIGLNHVAEIAANVITNRPIAGMIEQGFNQGYDTSWDGQLVADTTTNSQMAYRLLGVRSMAQQKSIEQFYESKTAQEDQSARRDILNQLTRSAIRDRRFDEVPALFEKYVENGGSPAYYTRWVKESSKAALDSRSERALEKALKDQTNRSNAMIARYLDGQVDIRDSDSETSDYGSEAAIDQILSLQSEAVVEPYDSAALPTEEEINASSGIY